MKIVIDGQEVELSGGGGVPKGSIIIWSGSEEVYSTKNRDMD